MQQFLFCTMLIVASEAFSIESRGNRISSVTRKFSRVAPETSQNYLDSDQFKFDDFDSPMFSMASSSSSSRSEAPYLSHLRRRGFTLRPFREPGFLRKRKRHLSRKRLKGKVFRKRRRGPPPPLLVPNSPQCFRGPDFLLDPQGHFQRSVDRPTQYIVCVYPVVTDNKFRLKEKTFTLLKKREFPRRQYPTLKNKRSTNTTTYTRQPTHDNYKPTSKLNFSHPLTPSLDIFDPLPTPQPFLPLTPYYTPYLTNTRAPLPLPKIDFKYPYDPELYDSSLRSDAGFLVQSQKRKGFAQLEDRPESPLDTSSAPPNLEKLKAMLEEVETVLKNEKIEKSDNDTDTDNNSELDFEMCEKSKKDKQTADKQKKPKGRSLFGNLKKKKVKGGGADVSETLKQKIDSVAIPVLSQISKELGKLSKGKGNSTEAEKKGKGNSKKKPPRCLADGTWRSSVLGTDLKLTTMPNMMLRVKLSRNRKNALINQKWSIHGLTLSRRGGPLMLAAVYPPKRQIASFIGQCKADPHQDMIFGLWTIYNFMQKFTDVWKAVEIKFDILRKQRITMKDEDSAPP